MMMHLIRRKINVRRLQSKCRQCSTTIAPWRSNEMKSPPRLYFSTLPFSESPEYEILEKRRDHRSSRPRIDSNSHTPNRRENINAYDMSTFWTAIDANNSKSGGGGGNNMKRRPKLVRDCDTIKEAVEMTHGDLEKLTTRNISAFWSVVPQLLQKKNARMPVGTDTNLGSKVDRILTHTLENIHTFDYRDIAQTTLGMAKIVKTLQNDIHVQKHSPRQIFHGYIIGDNHDNMHFIFDQLARASIPLLSEFDPRHLSNLMYGFGLVEYAPNVGDDGREFFDVVADEAIPMLEDFSGRDFANILWSYAKVKQTNYGLFAKAADIIVCNNLNEVRPQEISNMLWACAKLQLPHSGLFRTVGDYVANLDSLHSFTPQELSSMVWSYAKLDETHPGLFEKVANHIVGLDTLKRFNSQAISNTTWAFAKSNVSHPELFEKIANYVVEHPRLHGFQPQAFSNMLWAFATARESHPKLFKRVGDHIVSLDDLGDFPSQAVSNIVWAYATANESHRRLFQVLVDTAFLRQSEFKPQALSNFLWGYARIGQIDKILFGSFASTVRAQLSDCNSQYLSNIAWAYAVANVEAPSLFDEKFLAACLEKWADFGLEALCQLHQWQLWQEYRKSDIQLPPNLAILCREAFISDKPERSPLHNDVISQMKTMGLRLKDDVVLNSGHHLNAIVEVDGKKFGIDIVGPFNFGGKSSYGSTIIKHRQISNCDGVPVRSVLYLEWATLRSESLKQQRLQSLLGLA